MRLEFAIHFGTNTDRNAFYHPAYGEQQQNDAAKRVLSAVEMLSKEQRLTPGSLTVTMAIPRVAKDRPDEPLRRALRNVVKVTVKVFADLAHKLAWLKNLATVVPSDSTRRWEAALEAFNKPPAATTAAAPAAPLALSLVMYR